MSANCPNQADVRAELATLLQTKLVDNLDIVNEVHPSLCALTGKTTVMVEDAGIERLDDTLDRDSNKTIFYFKVYVFVPFGEDQAGWNAADAANHRNLIEKYIADCLIDNVETDFWHYIAHDGRSDPIQSKKAKYFTSLFRFLLWRQTLHSRQDANPDFYASKKLVPEYPGSDSPI